MFKIRFILVLGALSLVLMTLGFSQPFSEAPTPEELRWPPRAVIPVVELSESSDYYQRHPELRAHGPRLTDTAGDFYLRHPEWTVNMQNVAVPVTGLDDASDYFQRHPELSLPAESATDLSDYFTRHPELRTPEDTIDLSDYFQRH